MEEDAEESGDAEDDDTSDDEPDTDDTEAGSKPKKGKAGDGDEDAGASASDAQASPVAAERRRTAGVFASEHFKGREQAAGHLLTETDMSAAAIDKTLATLPAHAAGADAGKAMLEQAREDGQADVGDDNSADLSADAGNPLLAIAEALRKAQR